jgi:hypothetical protein
MIDHTGIGVADVGRSATFYDEGGLIRSMQHFILKERWSVL